MRNRYPGKCYRCGGPVGVGEGHFERHNGGWRTQHAHCAIVGRAKKHEAANLVSRPSPSVTDSQGTTTARGEASGLQEDL